MLKGNRRCTWPRTSWAKPSAPDDRGTRVKGQWRPRNLGVIRPASRRLKCSIHLASKALCMLLSWNLEETKKMHIREPSNQIRRLQLTYILIIFNAFNQHNTKLQIREEYNLFTSKWGGNWGRLLSLGLKFKSTWPPGRGDKGTWPQAKLSWDSRQFSRYVDLKFTPLTEEARQLRTKTKYWLCLPYNSADSSFF